MQKLWFKRKRYGWGWYPASREGWAITLGYIVLILVLASTLDEHSSGREVTFMFVLPLILLTVTFIRIAYKKGETPRWQWGGRSFKK